MLCTLFLSFCYETAFPPRHPSDILLYTCSSTVRWLWNNPSFHICLDYRMENNMKMSKCSSMESPFPIFYFMISSPAIVYSGLSVWRMYYIILVNSKVIFRPRSSKFLCTLWICFCNPDNDIPGAPPPQKKKKRNSQFFRTLLCQQLSFFTLLDRASFPHYK